MNGNAGMPSNDQVALAPVRSTPKRQFGALAQTRFIQTAAKSIPPMGLGVALGAIVLVSRGLPREWASVIILAVIAPTIALLVNDMRKLVLIVLILDIPLGLDIALANRPGHRGGPAGFLVSLMTIALLVGYARWLSNRSVSDKSKAYTHKDIAIPAAVYLFTMLVSALQATEVWFSITQIFLELQFLLVYFYLASQVRTWADVRLIFTTLAVCLLLESVLMLLQYYAGFELSALSIATRATGSNVAGATSRVGGTLGGPNLAATYLAASLAITFAAYLTDGRLVNKRLALVAIFPGVAALVLTQSRSGWIAFAVALLLLTTVAVRRRRIGLKAISLLFIVIMLLGVGFSTIIVERFTTDDNFSAESRIWYNELALNVIKEHPFTGVGVNNQRFVMDNRDYVPLELQGQERTVIHNTYLAIWVETGLFGFLAFLWLLLAAGRHALHALTRARHGYASIAITGLLAALGVYTLHMASATFTGRRMQFLWLILALIAATSRIAKETEGLLDPIPRSKHPSKTGPEPIWGKPLGGPPPSLGEG